MGLPRPGEIFLLRKKRCSSDDHATNGRHACSWPSSTESCPFLCVGVARLHAVWQADTLQAAPMARHATSTRCRVQTKNHVDRAQQDVDEIPPGGGTATMSEVTIAQVKRSDHAAPDGMHLYVVTVHFGHPNAAITAQVVAASSAQAITKAKVLAKDFEQIPPSQFTD